MTDAFALLWPPFLVALCLIGIHAYFGIEVLRRKVIFVDLALAQIAALGTTVAFMLGHPAQGVATYAYSLAFTLIAALLLSFTRVWSTRLPQEALIGVIYVVAAAAAILLIDRAPQGAEHLKQILTGNILTSGTTELATVVPLYLAVGLVHAAIRGRIAQAQGAWMWEFVFYATFGIVVTSSVAMAGVLLVFSFLIIPACIGVLYGETLAAQLGIGWSTGTFASAVGLVASYAFDLPTGAAIVCAFGGTLASAGIGYPLVRGHAKHMIARARWAARWTLGTVFAASATIVDGRSPRRSAVARRVGIHPAVFARRLFQWNRARGLPRRRRRSLALCPRIRPVERFGSKKPCRWRRARRYASAPVVLFRSLLCRNAQWRDVCHARSPVAGARASTLVDGARAVCAWAGRVTGIHAFLRPARAPPR